MRGQARRASLPAKHGSLPLDVYALWPAALCLAGVILLAASPAFRALDPPGGPAARRVAEIDGLRGLLALGVFFYHASIQHTFLVEGRWSSPSITYGLMGQGGVSLFFMVTGYLFWSRLIREAGRPDWTALYVGRLFRIAPVYYLAIAGMLLGTAAATGFHLTVDAATLALQLLAWLPLGLSDAPVNGFGAGLLLAGVTWSLWYEWAFYAALLPLAWLARTPGRHLPNTLILVAACILLAAIEPPTGSWRPRESVCALLFALGMLTASLQARSLAVPLPDRPASLLCAAILATFPLLFTSAYQVLPALALGLVFHLIAGGCSLFGLLRLEGVRRLGDISYGIYLLQGLALAATMRPAPLRAIALASPAGHWALVAAACLLLVVTAALAHVALERPAIQRGRRLLHNRLRRPSPRRISPAAPT